MGATELRTLLTKRRTQVEEAVAAESARLRQIESRIAQIDTENDLAIDDVVIRPEPAHRILTARKTVASFATARAQLQTVSQFVRGKLARESIGPLLAIAHAPEFEPDSIDVEFGFILQDGDPAGLRLPDGAALTVRELPAVAQMASCVRVGLPELAHLITGKIGRNGTLVIPAKLRRRFGLQEGGMVVLEETEDGISIRPAVAVPVEVYSTRRKAELLLNNAVDAADYKRAVRAVRKLGLDPETIPHRRP
jgi:AbrB family looped-hinge helix DNA binding protein